VGGVYGDLASMRQQLDQLEKLSLVERASDRAVYVEMFGGLCERNPARVFRAASLTAKTYFEDGIVVGPKGWFTALAYHLEGKENSARSEWQGVETVLREKLRARSGDQLLTVQLATTLAWLGRDDEAAREVQPVESVWHEGLNHYEAFWLAHFYAARGDAAKAVPYLRLGLGYHSFLTGPFLVFDPWWDKLRGQPEFDNLIKDVKAQIDAGKRVTP
ncbi:MAG: hypothetical protein JWM35_991, partial [Verrucomicrobia bacterium]|nr:hypothetical protein [Verrucomicrobiota bacterium]